MTGSTSAASEVTPLIALEAVRAVGDNPAASGKAAPPRIEQASLRLGAGMHAIVCGGSLEASLFVELVSGARRPTRGQVRIQGHDPAAHLPTRARLGVLTWEPILPPARTVRGAVDVALRARGVTARPLPAEVEALGSLLERPLRWLHRAEARAVELALAFCLDAPAALVLHEPFLDVHGSSRDRVAEGVARSAERGAAVLVITASADDARSLTESVFELRGGVLEPATRRLPAALELWLARATKETTRALAHALGSVEGVRSVTWRSHDDGGASMLRIEGSSLSEVARAIAREAEAAALEVHSLTEEAR